MKLDATALSSLVVLQTTIAYRHEIYKNGQGSLRVKALPSLVMNSPLARRLPYSHTAEPTADNEYDDEDCDDYYPSKGSKGGNGGMMKGAMKGKGIKSDDEDCDDYYPSKGSKGCKGGMMKGGMKGKGSKSKGKESSYPPKKGNGPMRPPATVPPSGPVSPPVGQECLQLNLLARVEDVVAGEQTTAVGETFNFPFYQAETLEAAGVFTDASTDLQDDECVFTGAYSTDYNNETDSFDSQINVAGTCKGSINSVTGGTGAFACVTGFEVFVDPPSDDYVASTLYLCDGRCHNPSE